MKKLIFLCGMLGVICVDSTVCMRISLRRGRGTPALTRILVESPLRDMYPMGDEIGASNVSALRSALRSVAVALPPLPASRDDAWDFDLSSSNIEELNAGLGSDFERMAEKLSPYSRSELVNSGFFEKVEQLVISKIEFESSRRGAVCWFAIFWADFSNGEPPEVRSNLVLRVAALRRPPSPAPLTLPVVPDDVWDCFSSSDTLEGWYF
jgi:hypothetical protein